MKAIRRFTVRAVIPQELSALGELAGNLRWSWHRETRQLFKEIDTALWESVLQDPIGFLGDVDPARLEQLAHDEGFVWRANALRDELRRYLSEPRWYQTLSDAPQSIGYFSPEFGIAAALPQYSGGLGILAGDHLKSASDLGLPLTAVGLFYGAGYFTQAISPEGWQLESYPVLDPDGMPLTLLREPDGTPTRIVIDLPDQRRLQARVWVAAVGRIPLLLLDTNVPENPDDLRAVTDRLYGGGGEHRLLQELLLGIGGVRALAAWSRISGRAFPEVFHTNEGHAGFLGLQRIDDLMAEGLAFDEALQVTRAATLFTTHTPVPAGIDRFPVDMIHRYFSGPMLARVPVDEVLALGSEAYPGGDATQFNMAVMGLRLAQRANGVSRLHGEVSREMFAPLWPGFDAADVPITSVTNGVHAPTWTDPGVLEWSAGGQSDEELWAVRGRLRAILVEDARRRLLASWAGQHPGATAPTWLEQALDPDVLTIGFARRVPTYKRLTLMLNDPERLKRILTDPQRPVQIVVAGKSHPADDGGKALIQDLVEFSEEPEVRGRIVFLPDYDIGMARRLYPGTDVWLNNPLRPLEACGTSGMKAALNGSLNLSILDGWWAERFDGENGWAIPTAATATDPEERDAIEAAGMYDLIEHRIAPAFYERDEQGVPHRWLQTVRHSVTSLTGILSADRMVSEYVERLYADAARSFRAIAADGYAPARELAAWKARVRAAWSGVSVVHVETNDLVQVPQVGDELHVTARIALGALAASDVAVELVSGRAGDGDELRDAVRTELAATSEEDGVTVYRGTVALERAGAFGYSVRVTPRHALLAGPAELGLIATA